MISRSLISQSDAAFLTGGSGIFYAKKSEKR